MFSQKCPTLQSLPAHELLAVSEYLCYNSPNAAPIYECIKVFMKLTPDGDFTYARHPDDLGLGKITAPIIVGRFRNKDRSEVVLEALQAVEEALLESWPFQPGSASWLQLEILDPMIRFSGPINKSTVVFRRAVRLNRLNKKLSISSTPLIENIFSRLEHDLPSHIGKFSTSFSPLIKLKNIAGSGVISEGRMNIEDGLKNDYEVAEDITTEILSVNFSHDTSINPGMYISFEGKEYKIVSNRYGRSTEGKEVTTGKIALPPLPIAGVLK